MLATADELHDPFIARFVAHRRLPIPWSLPPEYPMCGLPNPSRQIMGHYFSW
jgi:hypothetical protein